VLTVLRKSPSARLQKVRHVFCWWFRGATRHCFRGVAEGKIRVAVKIPVDLYNKLLQHETASAGSQDDKIVWVIADPRASVHAFKVKLYTTLRDRALEEEEVEFARKLVIVSGGTLLSDDVTMTQAGISNDCVVRCLVRPEAYDDVLRTPAESKRSDITPEATAITPLEPLQFVTSPPPAPPLRSKSSSTYVALTVAFSVGALIALFSLGHCWFAALLARSRCI
jgi:hypothetical protein